MSEGREELAALDAQVAELLARRLEMAPDAELPAELCRLVDAAGRGTPDPGDSLLARASARIDHVAIAVRDLDEAIEAYRRTLGFELVERRRIEGSASGMLLAEMRAGPITFVLVQGDSERSNVTRYVAEYGPGVQHVALAVDDLPALLEELDGRGCELLTGVIESPGLQQAFTRRDPNSGIQLEFVSRRGEAGFTQSNIEDLFEAMERENVV
jgi:4-hydroxyphenylpyruvate dioxygenase-like putative hemolysin